MRRIWDDEAEPASRDSSAVLIDGVARARRWAAHGVRAVVDVVLPPACLITDQRVDAPGRVAAPAWSRLSFVTAPQCARCGTPFAYDFGPETQCGPCLARPPAFDSARAALVYDDESRPLVLGFKHGGRVDGLPAFAGWMTAAIGAACVADVVVPTPLHAGRLRARRFNQAALLAHALARRLERPFDADGLARVKPTASQGGLSASGRRRNVAGAFRVRERARFAGARVLLVDDVFTTGATAEAATRALKRAGAARVDVVSLARVVRLSDPTTL